MGFVREGGNDNNNYENDETPEKPDPREAVGLSIFSKLKDRQKFLTLGEEGEKFIQTLKKLNEEAGTKFEFVSAKSSAIDAIMVKTYDGKFGVILGFAETATKTAETPVIQLLLSAIESAEKQGINVLSSIVVGMEDYTKPTNMFQNICNLVDVAMDSPSVKISIKDFKRNDIFVSTSMFEAKEILTKMYPHKVLPRMDVAAVFKLQDPRDRDNTAVIAVVTGYTDFIGMTVKSYSTNKPMFAPMFHMEVHSDITDPVLMALVLPSMVDIFCLKNQWLRVYDHYKEDMINLGSLIPASSASPVPFRAKDRNERDEFIEKYVDPVPNPCLDVFVGKAQLPLVKYLSGDIEDMKKFIRRLAGFLGIEDPNDIPPPIELNAPEVINFSGVIDIDGNLMDSRNVDYLHITSKTNNCERALSFLNYFENPIDRSKLIADTYPDFENRFAFAIKQVDFAFINYMVDILREKKVNFIYETRYDSIFSGGIFDVDTIRRNTSQIHISGLEKSSNRGSGFNFRMF